MNPRLLQIRERLEAIRSRLAEIEALPEPEGTDEARSAEIGERTTEVDALLDEWTSLDAEGKPLEARQAKLDDVQKHVIPKSSAEPGADPGRKAPGFIPDNDPFAVLEDRSLRGPALSRALVDANLRAIEGNGTGSTEDQKHFEAIIRRHAGDTRWAENILARQRPEYASAFSKVITGRAETLTEEERAAMAVGTNTSGGYLVPTQLDPTLMITNAGSSNIMRQPGNARIVTLIEGNVWHGVTSAGATASWDAELQEVSDDTPAVASASITISKPQAFIQATIEAFEDISSLTTDVLMLFQDAKDRLEGAGHMTGTGANNQPRGLFTAINSSASLQVVSTTAAVIGEVDVHALYRALPIRWRGRASFVANPLYTLAIKRLGVQLSSSYSGNLTEPVATQILGRPQVETDDAPTTQTTTALDQEVAFLPLSEYVIVDKPGSTSIEFIPVLFALANNLPDGRRGWYMHWRTGGDIPNLAAARCLVDKTSA
jgi:HK97 family phage major capsid protein